MDYKSITGLPLTKFMELQDRIQQILGQRPHTSPESGGRPIVLGLHQQLRLELETLRFNQRQAYIATKYGISQPTMSRIYRRLMPLLDEALAFETPDVHTALAKGESLVVDGTDVPVRKHKPAMRTHFILARRNGIVSTFKSSPRWVVEPCMLVSQCLGGFMTARHSRIPG